jgi:type IV pilus assembly protein PilW
MKSKGTRSGFTLLEVLLFSAISGILLSAMYLVYVMSHTTFVQGTSQVELQQNARVGIDGMAREVRMAGYDPSGAIPTLGAAAQNCTTNPPQGSGPFAVQVACANYISFVADVTGDGITDRVVYKLQGNQLQREIASWNGANFPAAVSSELAESVTALTFTYYDGSNAVTAVPASIRRIAIGITTQQTAGTRQETVPLTIDVRLRNLGP